MQPHKADCRLGGMAKGSGMIHPNMATTLNFITTDVAISADMIQKALSEIVKFASLNRVLTSDKMIYLFGRFAPYLSLVISMTLKFFPEFGARIRQVYQAQKCAGFIVEGRYFKRIRTGMRVISSATTWALERAVITGDSMHSRGYGIGRRTAFSLFRFHRRDAVCLAGILTLAGMTLAGFLSGQMAMRYYPYVAVAAWNIRSKVAFGSYLVLAVWPTGMHIAEVLMWKKRCRVMQSGDTIEAAVGSR